ncbi:hypothetical protein BJ991_000001, partial [Microbacterium immunditiarum]|nr:hypothetical protein [Microbacterium immunditiarum]
MAADSPPSEEANKTIHQAASGIPAKDRNALLGADWSTSGDISRVVMGGPDGLTVLQAEGDSGYQWHAVAALPIYEAATNLWISNSCVTSSGKYMAVVYGPREITNSERRFGGGANAVIVEFATGKVRELGTGFSIAYFNPGCGAGDTVTFTRVDTSASTTLLAVVDATTGDVRNRALIGGQATSAIADAAGTVYAVTAKGILRASPDGKPSVFASTAGAAYDLSIDDQGRLGYVASRGDGQAAAYLMPTSGKAKAREIASGDVAQLGLRRSPQGGFFLLGSDLRTDISTADAVTALPDAGPRDVISDKGRLIVKSAVPAGLATAVNAESAATRTAWINAKVPGTHRALSFDVGDVAASVKARSHADDDGSEMFQGSADTSSSDSAVTGSVAALSVTAFQPASSTTPTSAAMASVGGGMVPMTGDPHDPAESERYCAVPRNDPGNQAFQPKPRQIEWAVDRAVKGQLTETRPANWRGQGMDAYVPQVEFPLVAPTGGGGIPPQIVLGVLMQESNLWQADKYTQPGDTGNPLIGDFYGNRGSSLWTIDYPDADCGYGVGQITDGMRLAGHEKPGVTALSYRKQREIALDYEANIAMAVRMLGQKWNELVAAGITMNNADSSRIENWFATVWAYNTGLQPNGEYNPTGCSPSDTCTGEDGTWGLGWANNPINPNYPASRAPFLQGNHAADAATPQYWSYPEKVMGWAAWGSALVQTQKADASTRTNPAIYVSSYNLAWWGGGASPIPETNRLHVDPPFGSFCTTADNYCDPLASSPCALTSLQCWWHQPVTWKPDCSTSCGYGAERFPWPTYSTEASSTDPSLGAPSNVLLTSFPANCTPPPSGVTVVDDTTQESARKAGECTRQPTSGSFQFTFASADSNGNYPAKIDLHQGGGGYNAHFYFAHMQLGSVPSGKITGTWTYGSSLTNKWTRVWVHLPDHAGWTQQAAYTIGLGGSNSETRYLPQRRYSNEWVSLGVFLVNGTPTVSLSNVMTTADDPNGIAGIEDIAWDAVGFQPLASKPDDFVVALGDSYTSGEGAGSYEPWSDNNGSFAAERNACHVSTNSWIRKTVLPGDTQSIGTRADEHAASLDFHTVACAGAQTENLLPFYTVPSGTAPANGEGQRGSSTQYGMVSQLDAGYLDENTTLVTLSIGGNDMRFPPVVQACIIAFFAVFGADCSDSVLEGDTLGAEDASAARLSGEFHTSLGVVLAEIRSRAPNAKIVLMGYPKLF